MTAWRMEFPAEEKGTYLNWFLNFDSQKLPRYDFKHLNSTKPCRHVFKEKERSC